MIEGSLGTIDKLDLRVPKTTSFTEQLEQFLNNGIREEAHSGTRYYRFAANLTRCGLPSKLYFRHRRNGNHKLEIARTAGMTLHGIISAIGKLFLIDPWLLEIMRIDFAVDVPDYTVEWFRRRARVIHKRSSAEHGQFSFERTTIQTLYFGKRPHLFRIYDKAEQERSQHRHSCKRNRNELGHSVFEQKYGYSPDTVLTRVERQYGAGRVPKEIGTLAKLQQNVLTLNPFERLRFLPSTISENSANQLTGDAFLKTHGFLRLLELHGNAEATRILDHKTSRNTQRLLRQLHCMLADPQYEPPDLVRLFREAVQQQLSLDARCL